MPGVPTSRGCEACRKQKKKCDQARPSCSRCARLNLDCIGAGQQRFKFLEHQPDHANSVHRQVVVRLSDANNGQMPGFMARPLGSRLTALLGALNAIIGPSTDIRFNLTWTHGGYLREIPRRLGVNKALDVATAALVEAHSAYCSGRVVTPESLQKYSQGLRELRVSLDDPIKACATETLCAAQLLLLCQSLLGLEGCTSQHARGIAQMLKVRGLRETHDSFEATILAVVRGSLIGGALMSNDIHLSLSDWKMLARIPLFKDSYENKAVRCLCLIPYFIDSTKSQKFGPKGDTDALQEIRDEYQTLQPTISELKKRVAEIPEANPSDPQFSVSGYVLRMYGLSLWVASLASCVLSSVDTKDVTMRSELHWQAEEMLDNALNLRDYAPFGASIAPGLLVMAWVGAANQSVRSSVEDALHRYTHDPRWRYMAPVDYKHLERTSKRFLLTSSEPLVESDAD